MDKKFKNSLVLGKFYPVHLGHLHLINTAIDNSEIVNVMVCYNDSQYIPGYLRVDALREKYKDNQNVIIYSCDDSGLPQHDYECETLDEFYNYWVPFVHKYVDKLDAVFTSESYGDDFAKYLGVEHFLADERSCGKYQISGTKIRKSPFKYWEFIIKEIRPFFVKRIVIMGPESVGKSTLTEKLADHFHTNFVEEYGRTVYENNGNSLTIDDFVTISKGRQELEDDKIKSSNKLLFCDTEDITTYIFSKMYHPKEYKKVERWFLNQLKTKKKYDLYILLKPDCESIQDGTRNFLNERYNHYEDIKEELFYRNCNFIEIDGNWDDRFYKSIEIINKEFNI